MNFQKRKIVYAVLIATVVISMIVLAESKNGNQKKTLEFGKELATNQKQNTEEFNMEEAGENVEKETGEQKTTYKQDSTIITKKLQNGCQPGLTGERSDQYRAILLKWHPCPNDDFQYYKVVKSSLNSDPSYPNDDVILSTANKDRANFIDKTVAPGTTYHYRVCVVQKLKNISCGNSVSVNY